MKPATNHLSYGKPLSLFVILLLVISKLKTKTIGCCYTFDEYLLGTPVFIEHVVYNIVPSELTFDRCFKSQRHGTLVSKVMVQWLEVIENSSSRHQYTRWAANPYN